jgi:hypothetical protein
MMGLSLADLAQSAKPIVNVVRLVGASLMQAPISPEMKPAWIQIQLSGRWRDGSKDGKISVS